VQSIDPRVIYPQPDSSALTQIAVYRVAAWDTGHQVIRIPAVAVHLAGATREIPIVGRSVFVVSVLPLDTAQQKPKPPREIFESAFIPWWVWALIAAAVVLLLGFRWWWRHRRRATAAGEQIDPYVRAVRDFERIELLGLIDAGERTRHVALVVDVLREYIADRFTGAPLSLTSTELLSATRQATTLPHDRLMRVLNEADLIKFARRPVSAERARDIGAEARELVEFEHQASQPAPIESAGRAA
jgi:hypothetical protein